MTWAVREKGYSQRRACGLVGLHPKTYRYASKRSGDEGLRRQLRELASQRRRFGYRRLGLMLERQGIKLNRKKLYRLYKEERLTVRKRGGRISVNPRQPAAWRQTGFEEPITYKLGTTRGPKPSNFSSGKHCRNLRGLDCKKRQFMRRRCPSSG